MNLSFPFKAQAAGVIHSAFHSLSNATNVSHREYLLKVPELLERIYGVQEVSETCDLNGRVPNLQQGHFQSCFLLIIPEGQNSTHGPRAPEASGIVDPTQSCLCSLRGCFLFLL